MWNQGKGAVKRVGHSTVSSSKSEPVVKHEAEAGSSSESTAGIAIASHGFKCDVKPKVEAIEGMNTSISGPSVDPDYEVDVASIVPGYKYKKGNCFQCHKCPATFVDMRRIKTHWVDSHGIQSPRSCVVCKLPFPNGLEMTQHRKRFHGFACDECGKEFKKEKGLKDHARDVHKTKILQKCTACGASFDQKVELLNHIQEHHENMTGAVILIKCEHCDSKFLDGKDLDGHMLTHQLNFSCDHCNRKFQSRGAVRRHYDEDHPGFTMPTNEELRSQQWKH